MKFNFSFCLALILFSVLQSCVNTENPGDALDIDAETKKLRYLKEVEWPKAYAEQDTVLLDRILGDDFEMIDASGKWYTKEDELNWIKENKMEYDSFRYEIKRLDIASNGTAIVCGTGHIIKDSVYSIYQSSNVLIYKDSLWKAQLSHVSGYEVLNQ